MWGIVPKKKRVLQGRSALPVEPVCVWWFTLENHTISR